MSDREGMTDYTTAGRAGRLTTPAVDIKMPSLVTLGVDPGIADCGWGVVRRTGGALTCVDYGVIATDADDPMPTRVNALFSALRGLIVRHHVNAVAYEDLFVGRVNASTVLRVARALALLELAAFEYGKPIAVYTPSQIKKQVAGNGKAEKPQVGYMVGVLLGMGAVPKPDHAADALAAAITHSERAR